MYILFVKVRMNPSYCVLNYLKRIYFKINKKYLNYL